MQLSCFPIPFQIYLHTFLPALSTGNLSSNCRLELNGGERVRNGGGEEIPSVHSSPRRLIHLIWAAPFVSTKNWFLRYSARTKATAAHPNKFLFPTHRAAYTKHIFEQKQFRSWVYVLFVNEIISIVAECFFFNLEHCLSASQSFGGLQLGFSPAFHIIM